MLYDVKVKLVNDSAQFTSKRAAMCCKMQCYMLRATKLKASKWTVYRVH